MIGTPPFVAEVEAKAEEQAEVEADKDGHRHEPFEPLQWPGVLPRPPSAAEALSDFVMRGAHPDEEASSDPAWPDGAWLARTRLQRALLSEGGGWLVAYMIAAGGVSWRALAQQMVARPEWRPGLCASACIPWGSDLARALMIACVGTWMALPGGTRLESLHSPSAKHVRQQTLAIITRVEEQACGKHGAASLAATALEAGPFALALRLLAGCGPDGRAWTSDERLGAARRVLKLRILRGGGVSGASGGDGDEEDAAAAEDEVELSSSSAAEEEEEEEEEHDGTSWRAHHLAEQLERVLALLAAVHVLTACEGGEAIRREVEVLVRGDRQLKIFKHAARLAGLRGYRRSLRAVAEQAASGRPLAQCHGSAASLRRAGEAAGHGRSMLTLPLHEAAEVSPISAVPWAVTLWRDLGEDVLLAAAAHLHSWVVREGVSKEGHVAAFATRGEGEQADPFDHDHRALRPLFDELRARGLEIHVISAVGYPTRVFTLEAMEELATAIHAVVSDGEGSESERARLILLDLTRTYPCFRPHADAHYYAREGGTFAVRMRPPGGVPELAGLGDDEEEVEQDEEVELDAGEAGGGKEGVARSDILRMQAVQRSVADSLAALKAMDPTFAPPATEPITFARARRLELGGLRAPAAGQHDGPPPAGGRSGWFLDTSCQLPTPDGRMLQHLRPPPPGGEPLGRLPRLCARHRSSISWRLPDGLRVRFSARSELSFVVWVYPVQLAAQLPAAPLHPDYLSPAALVARSRVLTSADLVGDALQGEMWSGRPFEAVQLDASTIALWPAKTPAEPRAAFVPLPAWLSAPRELALDDLPPRVQLHVEGAGAARQPTDERVAGEEEGMLAVTPSTAATAAAAAAALEIPARERKRKRTAAALTADEARAAAAAEGLELAPSSRNPGGFKGVGLDHGRYQARGPREKGEVPFLGSFATAEGAALCYQRMRKRMRLEER